MFKFLRQYADARNPCEQTVTLENINENYNINKIKPI